MNIERHALGNPIRTGSRGEKAIVERRLTLAKWLYWARDIRPAVGEQFYGEPAWDLLLDLYIRQKCGTRSSVTSACIGARAPHTTALRYVASMCEAGWLERVVDQCDRRRNWLSLSAKAEAKLDRYFDRLLATMDEQVSEQILEH